MVFGSLPTHIGDMVSGHHARSATRIGFASALIALGMAVCAVPSAMAASNLPASNLGVGTRLKGAPTTVSPPRREILPQPFRPNCRWVSVRQSDPNLGWTTRRIMVCN